MYQPKLNLKFNPPLLYTESDTYYDQVIDRLCQVYPDLTWYGGDHPKNFNPFLYDEDFETDDRGIHYLTIGYFEDQPDDLTYTDTQDGMEYNNWVNGYQWVEEHNVDYDQTSGLFDSLNESEENFNIPEGSFVLKFDPPIESRDWERVAKLVETVYPELRWKLIGGKLVTLSGYNPIYSEDGEPLAYLYIRPTKTEGSPRRIMWDTEENAPGESDGPIIDGWKLIRVNDTYDMFDSLNESEEGDLDLDKIVIIFEDKDRINKDELNVLIDFYSLNGYDVLWDDMHKDEMLYYVNNDVRIQNGYPYIRVRTSDGKLVFGDSETYVRKGVGNYGIQVFYEKFKEIFLNSDSLFDSLNESVNPKNINKYKVGDRFLANDDLRFNDGGDRFVTSGQVYEIIRIDYDYDWYDYGYVGNRYVLHTDNRSREEANHGFSDYYLDRNFTYIPKGTDLDINYDSLYESDDLGWAKEVISNVSDSVNYTQLYEGMKVLPGGPNWEWGYQGRDAEYGTIEEYSSGEGLYGLEGDMDDENGGYWANVTWRNEDGEFLDQNNYRVGPYYFDLKHYTGNLNEGWAFLETKRYTQKFDIGDRVVMNGTVGGKSVINKLGTVLKYKLTGGGTGHPHRVYLILFDDWNSKERNFLMSPVQADQNREFIDPRCSEGSCWYTTSDNLEPAPDSNDMFDSLNESEEIDYENVNLTGLSYKTIMKDNDAMWIIHTVINDNGRMIAKRVEPSERMREIIGDNIDWDNLTNVSKKAVVDLLLGITKSSTEIKIVTMPNSIDYDLFGSINESENGADYSWLLNQSMVGLKFYEPNEFNDEGTIYTIVKESKNMITIDWVNTKTENWADQTTRMNKSQLIGDLNRGSLVIMSDVDDTSKLFDSLNESEDDLEWARDTIKLDPLIRPNGRMPRKGDRIRITSKDREWLDNYEQCFENPFDITVTVLQVLPTTLEVGTMCETDEFEVEFYVPFEIGAHARPYQDMDRFGIKIYPI